MKPIDYSKPRLPNRFAVELEHIKRPSFRQRLQILIGYNIKSRIKLLVDKRTGQVWEAVELTTTTDLEPKKSVTATVKQLEQPV